MANKKGAIMTQNETLARAFSFMKRPYWPAKRLRSGLIPKGPNGMHSADSKRGMKRVYIQENWPKSWKYSYTYDLEEIYGEFTNRGYAYAYDHRRKQVLRLLTERLAPDARILDIAAAQGNFSIALAEMGYNVTWNDLREDLADYVRLKQQSGKIEFAPGNAFELNFPAPFDAILIAEIIEHVAHPDEFLRKAAQLVKPGGYIVMTTPNGAYFRNTLPKFSECPDPSVYEAVQFKPNGDGHVFLIHPDEIKPLAVQAGLEVEEIKLFNNPLTQGFMKMEHALRVLPRGLVDGFETATQRMPAPARRNFMVHMAVRFRKPDKPN
jgi:2-polyprenyl-3-methyl-5-hydroxy-6-metoxy-1,4-benzoquinol methylase